MSIKVSDTCRSWRHSPKVQKSFFASFCAVSAPPSPAGLQLVESIGAAVAVG
jgi:hypothetical protein